jgi:hypothetical protein
MDENKVKELSPGRRGFRKFSTLINGEQHQIFTSHLLRA